MFIADNVWNFIDFFNVLGFWMLLYRFTEVMGLRGSVQLLDDDVYQSYRIINERLDDLYSWQSINIIVLWFKVFKFFDFEPQLKLLLGMFANSASPLFYFFITATLITIGFAHSTYTMFSADVFDLRSFPDALINGFKFWVTEMDLDAMRESSRTMGQLHWIVWEVLFLLIIASVFVGILSDAYAEEKEETERQLAANIEPNIGMLKELKFTLDQLYGDVTAPCIGSNADDYDAYDYDAEQQAPIAPHHGFGSSHHRTANVEMSSRDGSGDNSRSRKAAQSHVHRAKRRAKH